MSAFLLQKVKPEDYPAVVDVLYKAFDDPEVRMLFMGPDTPEQRQWLANDYRTKSETDEADFWIKIVDKASGVIVAVADWQLHPNSFPKDKGPPSRPWLSVDPELQQKHAELSNQTRARRVKHYTSPQVLLKILGVDPAFKRRGAGGLALRWGCNLADQLFLPMWIEASEEGAALYETFGFKKVYPEKFATGYMMKREAQETVIEGGKLVP